MKVRTRKGCNKSLMGKISKVNILKWFSRKCCGKGIFKIVAGCGKIISKGNVGNYGVITVK
jgi:hypothetical protein